MLTFGYTLDNELKVPMGQLPSGIQTQALEMSVTRLTRGFTETSKMLLQKVPGTGTSPIAGMSPDWQKRLARETAFVSKLPAQLLSTARSIALSDAGNAIVQSKLDNRWNRWAPQVLQTYSDTLQAYQAEVSRAMGNAVVSGLPAVYVKMAKLARTKPPQLASIRSLGAMPIGVDDPQYLAGLGQLGPFTPMVLGAVAGASLVGLAGWWFSRERVGAIVAGGKGLGRLVLEASYKGYDHAKDAKIKKAAGRQDDGSGYGFANQERDITFGFKQRPAAERAAQRIRRIRGVKTRIHEW